MVETRKETEFFLTESMTYASVSTELTNKVRKAYGYERGTVAGLRKKAGEKWRIYIYWNDAGVLHRKVLGSVEEVSSRIGL